ncbi:hypothetical protein JTE90_010744 [Oedothorax gibbosus]|uniref:Uncharacterized protein n=1 Tax=Oedothorax gibbosus TaxID=931172 RepID=A0AAV6UFE5_9ARAC|nr:hypothetical protein JTE90_010744 [Oedothorax gibbosus]
MEQTNIKVFAYSVIESITKVKTKSGVRLQIESYSCIDGISDGPHHLRLRRASHSNSDHQVTLRLTAPDCRAMIIERTLVFNRGTNILNLKIDKDEILYLMGPARRDKLVGELTVRPWNKSVETSVPLRMRGPCMPWECNSLKTYETKLDIRTDIQVWQKEAELDDDPVILEL